MDRPGADQGADRGADPGPEPLPRVWVHASPPRVWELRDYNLESATDLTILYPELELRWWWPLAWVVLEPFALVGDLLETLAEALTQVRSAYYDNRADTPD